MKPASKKKTAATRRAKQAKSTRSRARKSAKPASSAKEARFAPVAATGNPTGIEAVALEVATDEAAPVASPAPAAQSPSGASPAQRAGLKLEASFTLRDATDMLFQLLAVDFGDSDVLVDGSAVERIDTAGLQMLIAFAKTHAARGKPLRWTAASPELLRSSQLLGITEPLHLGAHVNEGVSGGH
jgi:anti-anti-sigma regulatory factor